ncbi:MAG TPA: response regulator transcription factor [Dehalococcoidia bacterium]|nr:response regulator transcription factor [Dehalococcoidia bacterium]
MPKKTTVLVVDDDVRLLRFVRANLETVGYKVLLSEDAETAIGVVEKDMPDLIILDIMLPEMGGLELARRMREFSAVPILMLTAKAEEADIVAGLRGGADDYMTKPFGVQELLARVEAILRRTGNSEGRATGQDVVKLGDLSIDFLRRRVVVRGDEVELTLTEYKLLSELATNAGKVMLHGELLSKVWGPEYSNEWEYLRAYVRRLRRKIEKDPAHPEHILSRPGFGYILVKPAGKAS